MTVATVVVWTLWILSGEVEPAAIATGGILPSPGLDLFRPASATAVIVTDTSCIKFRRNRPKS